MGLRRVDSINKDKNIKIIVLGGFGFIGARVVDKLSDSEYEIFPMSRQNGLDLFNYQYIVENFNRIKPDVIINSGPLRPLLAIDALFPNFGNWFARITGITSFCRNRAELKE